MQRFTFIATVAALAVCTCLANGATIETPQWIWVTKDRTADQSGTLRKSVELSMIPSSGDLQLLADFTSASVSINGRHVADVESYDQTLNIEISEFLREGENSISIHCQSVDGPSAIALTLSTKDAKQSQTILRSDSSWQASLGKTTNEESSPVATFGQVAEKLWAKNDITITTLDDYTQWKQAIGQGKATDPSSFLVADGFEIELLRSAAKDEDSWVSIAFDPQGRLTVAMEQKGLLRFTLPEKGKGEIKVERINDALLECRGLLYAYDSLYANANNSKGLYRLQDTNRDDQFDEVKLLYQSSGGVGHGRNDLALGPDGMIYSIHGDSVDVPRDCPDRTSPFREHRRGKKSSEGHVIRLDKDGKQRELVVSGLRNPFGIDFNRDGEMFTYDADAEHDMGSPWYRPTRVNHLLPGADFGWRGVTRQWPPYYPDRADAAPPTLDIGKGSPTAVKFGYQSNFPPPFRNALFALDWTYGRVLAVHATARGASYACRAETFLRGRPLNVTDLDFGPDGAMYLVTGGRKTQSALYRIKYVGPPVDETPLTEQQEARIAHARHARELRKRLETFHGQENETAIEVGWPILNHPDPALRHAARIAIEHQPIEQWQTRSLNEQQTTASLTSLMSLASGADSEILARIVARLTETPLKELATSNKWTALRTYQICLDRGIRLDDEAKQAVLSKLDSLYPDQSTQVNLLSSKLLARLDSRSVVYKTIGLLDETNEQAEKLHYLFILRNVKHGWTHQLRQRYLRHLRDMRDFRGGEGMPGFIARITEEALSDLKGDELAKAKKVLEQGASIEETAGSSDRKLVRRWTTDELLAAMEKDTEADLDRGSKMFAVAQCVLCHRVGNRGSAVGPDLTSVAARFSTHDLLESMTKPSKVVAEKYQSDVVTTINGQVLTGRIVQSGDYRSPTVRISTDPLDPSKIVEISKSEIESHTRSPISRMPEGLIDTLQQEEILDLIAYIRAGG